jgi:hypothetical protein
VHLSGAIASEFFLSLGNGRLRSRGEFAIDAGGSGYSGREFVPHFQHRAIVPDGHAPFLGEIDALYRPSIGQRVGPELEIDEKGVEDLVDVVEGIL